MRVSINIEGKELEIKLDKEEERLFNNISAFLNISKCKTFEFIIRDYLKTIGKFEDILFNIKPDNDTIH